MPLPPYPIFPHISSTNITLREINTLDLPDLIEISFYNTIQATSVQEAEIMQAQINQDYLDGTSIHWGIADNTTHKIVGTCGYYRGFDKRAGELGCVLLPMYRGQGYMTTALTLAIEFGTNQIGLKRIWAATSQDNTAAKKLLERLGFVKIADWEGDEIEYELRSMLH
jgi:[ribosomal protein S5]-alanine N-acetyltransferase